MSTEERRAAALDERIRAMPPPPLPAALEARVHARALAALREPGGGMLRRAAGVATASAVVSAVVLYLAWAVQFLGALAQG